MAAQRPYAVAFDGTTVTLPPSGEGDFSGHAIATWGESAENALTTFGRAMLHGRRLRDGDELRVPVALVHRPDNTYNDRAISVAMPASFGGDIEARHVGYVLDRYLGWVGPDNLPDLSGFASQVGAELLCTGILAGVGALDLDLPAGDVLGRAVAEFLDIHTDREIQTTLAHPVTGRPVLDRVSIASMHQGAPAVGPAPELPAVAAAPGSPVARSSVPPGPLVRVVVPVPPSAETTDAVEQLRRFEQDPSPVRDVAIALVHNRTGEPRLLRLTDAETGRRLGEVTSAASTASVMSRLLMLDDERNRQAVLSGLTRVGVEVHRPLEQSTPPVWAGDESNHRWGGDAILDVITGYSVAGLELRVRTPQGPRKTRTFAYFHPTTGKVWVEDARLLAPALIQLARLGIDVTETGTPRRPWVLTSQVATSLLRDDALSPTSDRRFEVDLLESARGLVPDALFSTMFNFDLVWRATPVQTGLSEPREMFVANEGFVAQRQQLFGFHEVTDEIVGCRLCGRPGLAFTAAVCVDPLSYCHLCLATATSGLRVSRETAAVAVGLLGEWEFGGAPMLEPQLDTIHVDPSKPVHPRDIDQLLLARFAVPRRKFAWTLVLEKSGLANDGLRTSRGTLVRARDGHLCHSLREKTVCDFLHLHGVAHEREPLYPVDKEHNPAGRRRADWRLEDGTFIELWGMPNDPVYASKMQAKQALVARHGIRLVELTDDNLPDLPTVLAPWLPEGLGTTITWSWSPIVEGVHPTRRKAAANPDDGATGEGLGRNAFNAAARGERLQRCREAVTLQDSGLSRRGIQEQMGLSAETIKMLLRDGKFYANPESDPSRLAIAQAGAEARASGTARAQFQATHGLSNPKVQEAWRDADVVKLQDPLALKNATD